MMDGMNAEWQRERAQSQLTLGGLIACLQNMPAGTRVANLGRPHSYRGYYCDLAFERHDGTRPVKDLLSDCLAAMGQEFTGYKGGDFVMGVRTPVWVAAYGHCGDRLLSVRTDGDLEVEPDDA